MYIVNIEETGKGQPLWVVRKNYFFYLYYIHMARLINRFTIKHDIFGEFDAFDSIESNMDQELKLKLD